VASDRNESPRKPRTPAKSAPKPLNPFSRRAVEEDHGVLEDVPGILGTIASLCSGGRAIIIGHTRDGGAWVIQILDGQERFKQYASTQSELDELFADLFEAYAEADKQD
jgi:hypothetical protein